MQTSEIKHPCVVDCQSYRSTQKKIRTDAEWIHAEALKIGNQDIADKAQEIIDETELMYMEKTCCAPGGNEAIQWPCPEPK